MTRTPIHPGEILQDELRELGLSAAALARNLDVPTNRITGILNGRRAVTADTALRLGHWFGMSAEFWLNLQKQYELRLAEKQSGAEIQRLPKPDPNTLAAGRNPRLANTVATAKLRRSRRDIG